jgi:hypothetical protein
MMDGSSPPVSARFAMLVRCLAADQRRPDFPCFRSRLARVGLSLFTARCFVERRFTDDIRSADSSCCACPKFCRWSAYACLRSSASCCHSDRMAAPSAASRSSMAYGQETPLVLGTIKSFKEVWQAKPERERKKLAEKAQALALRQTTHACLDQPKNHVAVALAGAAHGPKAVGHGPSNQTWRAPRDGLVFVAHAALREREGDRVEGGLRDRDADHGRFRREPMDATLAAVSVSLVMKRSSTGRAGASGLPTRRLGRRRFSGPRAAGKCEWSFGENPA